VSSRLSGRGLLHPSHDEKTSRPAPEQADPPKPKLAYSAKELATELGISKVSLWRLETRGLLRSMPYFRHKIYSREEVERLLRGQAKG